MKHILNNISQEEKQRILEQHSGGKKIDLSAFKRLTESKLGDVKPLIMEQSYTRGSIVSFVVGKSHQITGLNTVGCQNTFIQFDEIDPKTKKLTGAAPLYYVVTRAGALDSFKSDDYKVSDVNNSTNGAAVDNYNHKKMLGKIAKAAMISSGCK